MESFDFFSIIFFLNVFISIAVFSITFFFIVKTIRYQLKKTAFSKDFFEQRKCIYCTQVIVDPLLINCPSCGAPLRRK